MKLAVCSVQRNRGPWLAEWVVFHHLVGVTDFVLFLHECEDDSADVVARLSKLFRIRCMTVKDIPFRMQLACFQHAYNEFSGEFDWMAFIDGDEFLFPTRESSLPAALARFESLRISAVAAYWWCFGGSGHRAEPRGLVTENFRHCSRPDFPVNRHVKSIVRRGANATVHLNAHLFNTDHGTVDENGRPITEAVSDGHRPTWSHLRINHYATQSREFYERIKRGSGSADADLNARRPDDWWDQLDRNELLDTSLDRWQGVLANAVSGVCAAVGIEPDSLGGLPVHLR